MPESENNAWDNGGPTVPGMGVSKDMAPQSQEEAVGAALEDQEAYDQLGPRTREAMLASPVRWSAAQMLKHARSMSMRPTDARSDAMLAGMIRQHEPRIVEAIRVTDRNAVEAADKRTALQRIVDRAYARRNTSA